jgi:hypothetical protein
LTGVMHCWSSKRGGERLIHDGQRHTAGLGGGGLRAFDPPIVATPRRKKGSEDEYVNQV